MRPSADTRRDTLIAVLVVVAIGVVAALWPRHHATPANAQSTRLQWKLSLPAAPGAPRQREQVTLSCRSDGGARARGFTFEMPGRAALACSQLELLSAGVHACPGQQGDRGSVRITGTLHGRPFQASYRRQTCSQAEQAWKRIEPLWLLGKADLRAARIQNARYAAQKARTRQLTAKVRRARRAALQRIAEQNRRNRRSLAPGARTK